MRKIYIYTTISIIYLLSLTNSIIAQQISRQAAISAYIYNFANNIQWQNEDNIKQFHILIIGQDNTIINEMNKMSAKKKIRNKPIFISSSPTYSEIENVQIIFVTKGNEGELLKIFNIIEGKNILLISDGCLSKETIMINFFDSDKGTLLFEINKININNQNLNIMPNMVLLGGTIVDVKTLYNEGQMKLLNLQKNIKKLDSNLVQLENIILIKTKKINDNENNFNFLNIKIKEQQMMLDTLSRLYKQHQMLLQSKVQKIKEQQKVFDILSQNIKEQTVELKKGNEILQNQKIDIEEQKKEILSQSEILDKQGLTIHRQRNLLYLLILLIFTIFILLLTILKGYINKQKLNKELEKRVLERKKAEDELKIVNDNLEHKVIERTNDLMLINTSLQEEIIERENAEAIIKKQIKDLETKNIEMERFTYTVSHDLKSPLITINGFAGVILEKIKNAEYEDLDIDINRIVSTTGKMHELLKDLLELSKIGRMTSPSVTFNMTELANEVVELLQGIICAKNINIIVEENLPDVTADKQRIKEVVQNLIENAVKFMNNKENALIRIGCKLINNENTFFVQDNAAGIEEKYHQKIFGLFDKLNQHSEGTGIGLALVKRIIELHNGKVWVESELNKGSTFYFTLNKQKTDIE